MIWCSFVTHDDAVNALHLGRVRASVRQIAVVVELDFSLERYEFISVLLLLFSIMNNKEMVNVSPLRGSFVREDPQQ